MSSDFLTVDAAATILQMHPKTVQRHIREGRLRATKLGKQYRLLRSDLNAFAGASELDAGRQARVTSIVDVLDVDGLLLQRLTAVLLGAAQGKPSAAPMSVDIAHDAARRSAKVIIVGSPDDAAMMLKLVSACLEG